MNEKLFSKLDLAEQAVNGNESEHCCGGLVAFMERTLAFRLIWGSIGRSRSRDTSLSQSEETNLKFRTYFE
jgi:cytochrome b